MRLPDSFSFRQKPRGVFKKLLRLPVRLYDAHLGFVMGERFVLITHTGRRSGLTFRTVVEVVEHDPGSDEYIVSSGTGPRADWYLNLRAHDASEVQVGERRWVPAQRLVPDVEAADRFSRYERLHPRTAARLLDSMGRSYDGTDEDRLRMIRDMPMVAFGPGPSSPDVGHRSSGGSRSLWSTASTGSVLSLWSTGSILSIASSGSVLSIGSSGSVLSIGSFLSAGSVLSALSYRSMGSLLSTRARWGVRQKH